MKGLIFKWLISKGKVGLVGTPNLVAIVALILLAYALGEWDALEPIVDELMQDAATSTDRDTN